VANNSCADENVGNHVTAKDKKPHHRNLICDPTVLVGLFTNGLGENSPPVPHFS
jgi:hypothetical protein